MMENAGLNLARLTASIISKPQNILIGIGTGNNGGGGLVAARRLLAWGYSVYLHIPNKKLKPLPQLQLDRALAFGAIIEQHTNPDIFLDAYLGFSQRLPLSEVYTEALVTANTYNCTKISLDIPTGFNKTSGDLLLNPNIILTLATMKTELLPIIDSHQIYIADLGIPNQIYNKFGVKFPAEFNQSGILKCYSS